MMVRIQVPSTKLAPPKELLEAYEKGGFGSVKTAK
jgi:hypothetical protein